MKFLLVLTLALFASIADARTTGGPMMATQGDPTDGNDSPRYTVVFLPPSTLFVIPY